MKLRDISISTIDNKDDNATESVLVQLSATFADVATALVFANRVASFSPARTFEEPKVEALKAEAPKVEALKAEEPKAEVPKAEAPKAEAQAPLKRGRGAAVEAKAEAKVETPKAEAPKAEAKVETPKAEAKVETPKAEAPKAEAKVETPKAEAPKAEAKVETPKAEDAVEDAVEDARALANGIRVPDELYGTEIVLAHVVDWMVNTAGINDLASVTAEISRLTTMPCVQRLGTTIPARVGIAFGRVGGGQRK